MRRYITYISLIVLLLNSCIEEVPMEEKDQIVDPTMELSCRLIGSYSASLNCEIGKTNRYFTSGGFLYGTDPEFKDAQKTPGIVNTNELSIIISNLAPDKTYYVKAYIADKYSEVTSDVVSLESVAFSMDNNCYDIPYTGGTIQLKVRTAEQFDVDTEQYDWINSINAKSTNSNYSAMLYIDENTSMESRVADVIISSKDGFFKEKVTVKQAGAPVMVESPNIKSYLIQNYDKNNSNEIELEEIPFVEEIVIIGKNVYSLAGIEYFYNLKKLVCKGSMLNEADLTHNTSLEYVDISYNNLTMIDISDCDRLISLNCSYCRLDSIDLSSAETLQYLDCSSNNLKSLDLSYNYQISDVNCNNNAISEFKSSRSSALKYLNCSNNNISNINLTSNKGLINLNCGHNYLSELILSSNTLLTTLNCCNNYLTVLDLRRNTQLETIDCSHNEISRFAPRHIPLIRYIDCSNNNISSLDLSRNTYLQYLNCSANQINNLDLVGFCPDLKELYCNNDVMTTLYIESDRQLAGISINRDIYHVNSKTIIRDHSGMAYFEDLEFKAYMVKFFDGDGDGEISLDEAMNIASINLCTDNIRSLKGIEYLYNLKYIKCEGSDDGLGNGRGLLTELDLSSNPFIEQIICGRNKLKYINTSNNVSLKTLWCYNNSIEELDLSNNINLTNLNCQNNLIEYINISKNQHLKSLDCSPMNDSNGINCLKYLIISPNQQIDYINSPLNPRNVSNIPSETRISIIY